MITSSAPISTGFYASRTRQSSPRVSRNLIARMRPRVADIGDQPRNRAGLDREHCDSLAMVDGATRRRSALAFLTTGRADGINANMRAELVHQEKRVLPDGSIVEMVIWKVPSPLLGSAHSYKYRLYFGREGKRIVGFDNERGKGDHCHLGGVEQPYVFSSVETLVQDFLSEVFRRMPG